MFNVSAIHINYRSWLRSSSTHEPSDPPLGIVSFKQPSRDARFGFELVEFVTGAILTDGR